MVKKIIFNIIIAVILIMIAMAIIKANKPKSGFSTYGISNAEKQNSNLNPKEAKYYKVIEE